MKPTFRIHFSEETPTRPGLWVSRRGGVITVLQIDAGDIERQKRENTWLDGQWGACIEIVDRDLVPLDRRKVQEYLDPQISLTNERELTDVCEALQNVRLALLGECLELPKPYKPEDEPQPMD